MTQKQTQLATQPQPINKKFTQKILAETQSMIAAGRLQLPPDYSVGNAISAAWLMLQEVKDRGGNPALQVCTPISVANALRYMIQMGLSPVKQQCYFVVHGDQLTLMRSYFGSMMVARRVDPEIADIVAELVYKGDIVETDSVGGRQVVTMHKTNPFAERKIDDVTGAYCNIIYKDGHWISTIMSIGQIHRSWDVGKANRNSPAHRNTPEEMIRRTVIQRACKAVINTSTDRSSLAQFAHKCDMEAAEAERNAAVDSGTNVINVSFEAKKKAPAQAATQEVVEAEIIEPEPQAAQPEPVMLAEPEPAEPDPVPPAAEMEPPEMLPWEAVTDGQAEHPQPEVEAQEEDLTGYDLPF